MRQTRRRGLLIGLAYLAFVSLGLPDGLLGVAWPSIRASFGLPLEGLGVLLAAMAAGALLSSFGGGPLLARLSVGPLLALSTLATAASLLGYALAPGWWLLVGLGGLLGLGGGAIDASLNTWVATRHGARALNWLHASYGVGVTVGPLVMAAALAGGLEWRWGYAVVGAVQGLLALAFGLTRGWWAMPAARGGEAAGAGGAAPLAGTLRLPLAWLGIALFFVYAGVEVAAGQWAFSLLTEARGLPAVVAGIGVGVYWGALTVGRVLSGVVVGMVSVEALIRGSLGLATIGAALIWSNAGALPSLLGLALLGLALAPIYPSLMARTPARLGPAHAPNAVGFQVAAAILGVATLPAAVGLLASRLSLEVLGPALLAGVCLMWALHEALVAASAGTPVTAGQSAI